MHREQVGAAFMVGQFMAEALYLAESAAALDCISIAGTARATQLHFFVAACDYTLIAEEIFVISAYLTQDRAPKLAWCGAAIFVKLSQLYSLQ